MDSKSSDSDASFEVDQSANESRVTHDDCVAVPPPGGRQPRAGSVVLARVVTEILAPVPLASAMLILLGSAGDHHWPTGLILGVAAVLITIAPPYAFVLYGVHRGQLTDRHLGDRRQRPVPLLLGVATAIVGVIALALLGAPRLLLAGVETSGIGLLVTAGISQFWKMSGHTAMAAAVLLICARLDHGWPLFAMPVLAVIGWARVKLRDHTIAQAVAGVVVGALVADVSMWLLT